MAVYLASQWRIQVQVPGLNLDSASWDKAAGGDIQPKGEKYMPGGMQPTIAVGGGARERADLVVQRAWSDAMISAFIGLDNASGHTPATVSMTPLKTSKSTVSKPITYTGVLGPVKRPDADSTSSSIEYLELTLWCNESITG